MLIINSVSYCNLNHMGVQNTLQNPLLATVKNTGTVICLQITISAY